MMAPDLPRPAPSPARPETTLRFLARYLRRERPRLVGLAGLLSLSIGLQLGIPQIQRRFIDGAQAGMPTRGLAGLAGLVLLLALGREVATAFENYLGQDLRWRATNRMRGDLTRHCLRLSMDFHHGQTPGKMIERVDGDITALSNLMSDTFLRLLANGLVLIGVLLLLAREDLRLGAAFALFVLVGLVGIRRAAAVAVPAWSRVREASAELFGFLEERLAGLEDIRALGAGRWVKRRFMERHREYKDLHKTAGILGASVWMGTVALFTLGNVLAFGMGAWLFGQGRITIGTVYLIFHYTEMLRGPIEQMSHQLEDVQKAGGAMARVRELFGTPVRQRTEGGLALAEGPLSLEASGLGFSYAEGRPVLEGIDLRVAPGEVLGILGRTGSGKTTLSRLIFRLYDRAAGSLRLGGVDLEAADLVALRRRVGLVTQDVQVLSASVRDNLSFFDPSIPDARMLAIVEDLGLGDWLRGLPAGLDSELEAGASGLSAGEAQLLAFARVFLREPGLVILDEASARLDPVTEQRIERAVDRLLEGRTGIIIAHRLGTVERCDRILILDQGRVLEQGPRRELAADPNTRFSALLRAGEAAMQEVLA